MTTSFVLAILLIGARLPHLYAMEGEDPGEPGDKPDDPNDPPQNKKRARVAERKGEGDDGHVEINEEALTKIGITVGATALQNAVEELLSK